MEIFNNRELASATLLGFVFLWVAYRNRDVVTYTKSALCLLLKKEIVIIISSLVLYTSVVVYLLFELKVWNGGQLKNTILWFIFTAFVHLLNTNKINNPKDYLRKSLNAQVKLIVFIEFFVAFHTYSYISELVLVSFTSLFSAISVISKGKAKYADVKKIADGILSVVGILLLWDTVSTIYEAPATFFSIETFRDFLVPMLLSVSLLPYIYTFYYFLAFEKAFLKTHIYTDHKALRRYAQVKSIWVLNGNPEAIKKWLAYSCKSEFESKETVKNSIKKFKNNHVKSIL